MSAKAPASVKVRYIAGIGGGFIDEVVTVPANELLSLVDAADKVWCTTCGDEPHNCPDMVAILGPEWADQRRRDLAGDDQ